MEDEWTGIALQWFAAAVYGERKGDKPTRLLLGSPIHECRTGSRKADYDTTEEGVKMVAFVFKILFFHVLYSVIVKPISQSLLWFCSEGGKHAGEMAARLIY